MATTKTSAPAAAVGDDPPALTTYRFTVVTGAYPTVNITGVQMPDGKLTYMKQMVAADLKTYYWSDLFNGSQADIEALYGQNTGYAWTWVDDPSGGDS